MWCCILVLSAAMGYATAAGPSLAGQWGGPHISLTVTDASGALQYDCAHGAISGPLELTQDGSFQWEGTHTLEHGGPMRSGEAIKQHPARYTGRVEGDQMTLGVTLTETGQELGPYELERGRFGQIHRCL